uniref:Uncharacterized protein n=1 Tax=Dunaliella tertiolecta TaxID=3047 RepID=A0A7S3VK41_DUNTE
MHAAEHQAPSSTLLRASAACNLPSFEDCLTQAGCCLYKWGLPPPGVPALAEILKENCPLRVGDGGAPTRRKMVGRLEGACMQEGADRGPLRFSLPASSCTVCVRVCACVTSHRNPYAVYTACLQA